MNASSFLNAPSMTSTCDANETLRRSAAGAGVICLLFFQLFMPLRTTSVILHSCLLARYNKTSRPHGATITAPVSARQKYSVPLLSRKLVRLISWVQTLNPHSRLPHLTSTRQDWRPASNSTSCFPRMARPPYFRVRGF